MIYKTWNKSKIYDVWLKSAKLSQKELAMAEKAAEKRSKDLTWGPLFPTERTYFLYKKAGTDEDVLKPDKKIMTFLNNNGYDIVDYKFGLAAKKDTGQKIGIGKVLNRFNEQGLKKIFDERLKGAMKGINEDLYVCFSYNHEDIAGMSTDRNWTSCMNLREADTNVNYFTYENKQVFSKIIKGGMVAYLIKESDKNIENPLARISIRRYVAENSDSFIFLASDVCYGIKDKNFVPFVQEKIDKSNEKTTANWQVKYKDAEKGYEDIFPKYFSFKDLSADESQIVNAKTINKMLEQVLNSKDEKSVIQLLNNLSYNYYTSFLRKIIDFDKLFENIISWMSIKNISETFFTDDFLGGHFNNNKYSEKLFNKKYETNNFNDIMYLYLHAPFNGNREIQKTVNWIIQNGTLQNAFDFSMLYYEEFYSKFNKDLIQYMDKGDGKYLKAFIKKFGNNPDIAKIKNITTHEDIKEYIKKRLEIY